MIVKLLIQKNSRKIMTKMGMLTLSMLEPIYVLKIMVLMNEIEIKLNKLLEKLFQQFLLQQQQLQVLYLSNYILCFKLMMLNILEIALCCYMKINTFSLFLMSLKKSEIPLQQIKKSQRKKKSYSRRMECLGYY